MDITNYSFANYPKIKIYKLNANDLKQYSNGKYDFEFPPSATGNLNDISTASNEYDKTIIAGFGGATLKFIEVQIQHGLQITK